MTFSHSVVGASVGPTLGRLVGSAVSIKSDGIAAWFQSAALSVFY